MPIPIEILERLQANDPTLVYLDLKKRRLTDSDIKLLHHALKNNTHLKHLDVSLNRIEEEGAKLLAKNKNLKYLNISLNLIGDPGAKAFSQNTTLEHLDIAANLIGKGVKYFAEHTHLKRINTFFNQQISDTSLTSIRKQVPYCRFNMFNTMVDSIQTYPMRVVFNASLHILNLSKDEMDKTSRTLNARFIYNRQELLKALSLCLQTTSTRFSSLPQNIITNEIFGFLLPKAIIEIFLNEKHTPSEIPWHENRNILNMNSMLFVIVYWLLLVSYFIEQSADKTSKNFPLR